MRNWKILILIKIYILIKNYNKEILISFICYDDAR